MLLLAIDTAGPACAVAVVRDGVVLARTSEEIGRGHAERLMPMIEAALAGAHIAFADLNAVAVTTGPGSFTGVRVGVAAARGLAVALGIPAIGIGSLDALAFPIVRERSSGTVVAALDAKRGDVYLLARDLGSGETLVEASAVPVDSLAATFASASRPLILIGSGAPILAAALDDGGIEIAATPSYPEIVDVARLATSTSQASPPVPLYARAADAKPQAHKALPRR
jgi:tRNA threonylcarbamoyladenosine biosynthesis protein TsaB